MVQFGASHIWGGQSSANAVQNSRQEKPRSFKAGVAFQTKGICLASSGVGPDDLHNFQRRRYREIYIRQGIAVIFGRQHGPSVLGIE